MSLKVAKDDLLFHAVHGLCRVAAVTRTSQSKESSYSLSPVSTNKDNARFIIPESALITSGFNQLVSQKEANAILDYFKTGKKAEAETAEAWMLAAFIWEESCSKETIKDARKRQRLERSVKGLAGELAVVLKLSFNEMVAKIQKNLESRLTINPLVVSVFAHAFED